MHGDHTDRQRDHADRLVHLEAVLEEQIEDQDRAEDIEHNPSQAAGVDVQCFPQGKSRSADEQDGQDVIGKGGGKNGK